MSISRDRSTEIVLDGASLTLERLEAAAFGDAAVRLAPSARAAVAELVRCGAVVDAAASACDGFE
jgi:hypothetical protein